MFSFLFNKINVHHIKKGIISLTFFCLLFLSSSAWAAYDVNDMLLHLQRSLGPLFNLAIGSMYVIGIALAVKGVYDLRMYGESRTMMSSSTSIKGPIITLVAGIMCIYSPSAFNMVMMTTFGYGKILAYDQFPSSSGQTLSTSEVIMLQIVQVIGAYAFLRGWILISRTAHSQGGHGTLSKGIIHVVGGVFGMNIVGTFNVIANTFGITF